MRRALAVVAAIIISLFATAAWAQAQGVGPVGPATYVPVPPWVTAMYPNVITLTGGNLTVLSETLANGGNFAVGEEQTRSDWTGIESTFGGDRAGGAFTGAANANTAFGHNSEGISWQNVTGVTPSAPSGSYNSALGNDALRDIWGTASGNTCAGQHSCTAVGGNDNAVLGVGAGGGTDAGTTFSNVTALGYEVGNATLTTATNVVLIGTSSTTDSNVSSSIHVGAGSSDVWSATGTGTPSTSATTIAGSETVVGRLFSNGATGQLSGQNDGFGTLQTIYSQASSTTTSGQFSAARDDFSSSFASIFVTQNGSAASGTTLGFANAGLQMLQFINPNHAVLIYTNSGSVPMVFGTGTAEAFRADTSNNLVAKNSLEVGAPTGGVEGSNSLNVQGIYYQNGTAGVTATGVTSCVIKSIAGGIVTSATCT